MNNKERKELSYFPAGLDAAVTAKFGAEIECTTEFNIISMTHITTFKTEDPILKEKVDTYIEGFLAGNKELNERLYNCNNKN